ncbi:MAG: rhamnan synthesis F family protein [Oscillospiraceae bacterium]
MDNYDLSYTDRYRVAIYLFWDKDGLVDDYVTYYLKALRSVANRIIVVCNGKLTDEGRAALEEVCDKVHIRENKGYDGWAYKDVIENVIGWERLCNYDELIITNNTLYGPFVPFEEMFEDMAGSRADFWGIQKRYEDKNARTFLGKPTVHGYIPDFIPSNFWVIRKKVLLSKEFKSFWDELPMLESYSDSCINCEPVFSKTLVDAGFIMDTYVGDSRRFSCVSPTECDTLYQLREENVPVVRRKTFFNPLASYIRIDNADNAVRTMEYITENSDYDVSMIYKNLCRTTNLADFHERLHLNHIIPYNRNDSAVSGRRTAVICYLENAERIEVIKGHLRNFSDDTDIYLICSENLDPSAAKEAFSECGIRIESVRKEWGGWAAALLVASRDIILEKGYDFICFVRDIRAENAKWLRTSEALEDRCYDAVMGSASQINGIIGLFESDKSIGAVSAVPAYHAGYYESLGGSWGDNFDAVEKLYDILGLTVSMEESKFPVYPFGGIFWFRPAALNRLLSANIGGMLRNDKLRNVLEYIVYYSMQEDGYYPVYAMSDTMARLDITNHNYLLRRYNELFNRLLGHCENFEHRMFQINNLLNKKPDEKTLRVPQSTKQSTNQSAQQTTQQSANQSAKQSTQQTAQQSAKQTAQPSTKQTAQQTTQQSSREMPQDVGYYTSDEVNFILDNVPFRLLVKKMIKRIVPKKLWQGLRKMFHKQ